MARTTARSDLTAPAGTRSGFLAWLMAPERRGPLLVTPAIVDAGRDEHLSAALVARPQLLQLPRQPAGRRPTSCGSRNFERVLTDDTVWERFQTTALIVGSSVLLQLIVGFLLALLFERRSRCGASC